MGEKEICYIRWFCVRMMLFPEKRSENCSPWIETLLIEKFSRMPFTSCISTFLAKPCKGSGAKEEREV